MNASSTTWRVWIIMQYDTCILQAQFVIEAGGARALNTAPRSFTFTSLVIQNVAGLHVSLVASVFWLYFCSFQEAYAFWICSTHLPMWLLDSDSDKYVEVEACRSTCLMVEKRCPFLIKGTEDDMASGNPSFMCKGKGGGNLDKSWSTTSRRLSLKDAQLPSLFLSMHFLSHWLFCQCNDSTRTAPPPPSPCAPSSRAAELEIPNCQPRYTTLAIPDKAVGSYCTPRQILAKKSWAQNLLALPSSRSFASYQTYTSKDLDLQSQKSTF